MARKKHEALDLPKRDGAATTNEVLTISLTLRERDTIVAALRLWRLWLGGKICIPVDDVFQLSRIAKGGRGDGVGMSAAEIDAIIHSRLNV